jgi:adenylate cyclase
LVIGEKTSLIDDTTHNLKAYLTLLKTREHAKLHTKEGNEQVRKLSKEAIALDPDYAHAYWWLAYADVMDVWFGFSKSPKESLLNAIKTLQKSIDIDESFGHAYGLLGHIYSLMRQYEKAILAGEKAVELAPNSNSCLVWLAGTLRYIGKSDEAIPLIQKALRQSPFDQSFYLLQLGHAYRGADRYEDAIKAYRKTLQYAPDNIFAYISLTASYIFVNEEDKARDAAAEVLRINPNFSVERFSKMSPIKDKARNARFDEALRKAGLK